MVTSYVTTYQDDGFGRKILKYAKAFDYDTSPRYGGMRKLQLRSNRATLSRQWYRYRGLPAKEGLLPPELAEVSDSSYARAAWPSLEAQAYQRWRGKLMKGSASMGVTLASWKQSRDMIVKRSKQLGSVLSAAERRWKRKSSSSRKKLRRKRELLADDVLEYKFGWAPLFQDFHAALSTVYGPLPPTFIAGRASGRVVRSERKGISPKYVLTGDGTVSVSYSTRVVVENPNLVLLNRLGLINPATVIWDLIPWSFVVNMFVNVNSFISQFTDEVGYNVTDRSITRSYLISNEAFALSSYGSSTSNGILRYKERVLGVKPTVRLQVQVPDLSWGLAVTAASLVVQKFKRLNQLIGI